MSHPAPHPFLNGLRNGVAALKLQGHLLLAVSGGADSVALLRGMLQLQQEWPLKLAVAHFNHRLRGEESDRDQQWLSETCAKFGLECLIGTASDSESAKSPESGIEETARNSRYTFLKGIARERGFETIAVAHTRDDQAETVLHHLLRGTGISGLQGIPPHRELSPQSAQQPALSLVRPMLTVTHTEAVEYLAAISQDFREDPSNADTSFTRNRIRHELLPHLEQSFNPQVREVLCKLSQQAGDIHDTLRQLVKQLLREAILDAGDGHVRLNHSILADQTRHLIRECYAELWKHQNWPRQRMTFEHYDRLAEITLQGGAATLPGNINVQRRGELVVLLREK